MIPFNASVELGGGSEQADKADSKRMHCIDYMQAPKWYCQSLYRSYMFLRFRPMWLTRSDVRVLPESQCCMLIALAQSHWRAKYWGLFWPVPASIKGQEMEAVWGPQRAYLDLVNDKLSILFAQTFWPHQFAERQRVLAFAPKRSKKIQREHLRT